MPGGFNSGLNNASTYFISWMGPRHGLIVVKKRKHSWAWQGPLPFPPRNSLHSSHYIVEAIPTIVVKGKQKLENSRHIPSISGDLWNFPLNISFHNTSRTIVPVKDEQISGDTGRSPHLVNCLTLRSLIIMGLYTL